MLQPDPLTVLTLKEMCSASTVESIGYTELAVEKAIPEAQYAFERLKRMSKILLPLPFYLSTPINSAHHTLQLVQLTIRDMKKHKNGHLSCV